MLNDITAYKTAFHLSNTVWQHIMIWDRFNKDTLGKQYVRAIDSISANLAEGYGMHSKKEKIRFYRYARASTYECLDWTEKARVRGLFSEGAYENIFGVLKDLPKLINTHIKYTENNLKE